MEILILILVLLLLFLIFLLVIFWVIIRKLVQKISQLNPYSIFIASLTVLILPTLFLYELFKGRDGDEIYEAAFKSKRPDCVHIISYKDAHLPMIDNDIRLHFRTCPQEMARILSLDEYEKDKIGDTAWYFRRQNGGGGITIDMNADSTEASYYNADF